MLITEFFDRRVVFEEGFHVYIFSIVSILFTLDFPKMYENCTTNVQRFSAKISAFAGELTTLDCHSVRMTRIRDHTT